MNNYPFIGHKSDIWKGNANIQPNGAVFTGTYTKLYTNLDCQYNLMNNAEKIEAGAIDLTKEIRNCLWNGPLIEELKNYYIVHFYNDGTNFLITSSPNHWTYVTDYWIATMEILKAAPKEVAGFYV